MDIWAVWVESGTYADSRSIDLLSLHKTKKLAEAKAFSFPKQHKLELAQRTYKNWLLLPKQEKVKAQGYYYVSATFFEYLRLMTWDEWEVKTKVLPIKVEED